MPNPNINRRVILSGENYTSAAQSYFTAAEITDANQKRAYNNLVVSGLADGWYSKMIALYPVLGGTSSSCSYNAINTSLYNLTFSGGNTFSANGWMPNGINGFANTGLNVGSVLNPVSHSFGIYSRTNSTSGTQVYGAFQTSILQNNLCSANLISGDPALNPINYTGNPSTRLILLSRESSTSSKGYRNGTLLGTDIASFTTWTLSREFYFGARNFGGAASLFMVHEHALMFLASALTPTDVANFTTAVNTFQTALGRNV